MHCGELAWIAGTKGSSLATPGVGMWFARHGKFHAEHIDARRRLGDVEDTVEIASLAIYFWDPPSRLINCGVHLHQHGSQKASDGSRPPKSWELPCCVLFGLSLETNLKNGIRTTPHTNMWLVKNRVTPKWLALANGHMDDLTCGPIPGFILTHASKFGACHPSGFLEKRTLQLGVAQK